MLKTETNDSEIARSNVRKDDALVHPDLLSLIRQLERLADSIDSLDEEVRSATERLTDIRNPLLSGAGPVALAIKAKALTASLARFNRVLRDHERRYKVGSTATRLRG